MTKIQTSMRIDKEILIEVKKLAKKSNRSHNFIFEELIQEGLKVNRGSK
jgi:predicted transcriptional regulator